MTTSKSTSASEPPAGELAGDNAALTALGYEPKFKREMSLWANFAIGFAYLSPVVGIYVTFAIALGTGGPPMIWTLVIAGVGQLLVAMVFGEVVSQFPVAGGIYPWARRLWGRKWAWMTGWVYMFALFATLAANTYGAGPYLSALLGVDYSVHTSILLAIALMTVATFTNFAGTRVLSAVAKFGFVTELIGALAVGAWLLVFSRHHGLDVLFDTHGVGDGRNYVAAFLAAGLIGVYQYYGFEACGDVAEEVPDPSRHIPKTMRMTIYVGGGAAIFVCLALILAITDFAAVISGENTDPINQILLQSFGPIGSTIVLVVVLISFFACTLSLQAASSRLMFAYARDNMIMGSHLLSRFNERLGIPPAAIVVTGIIPCVLVLIALVSEDGLFKIVSFATAGIYIGFQMVVLAALRARLRGWVPSGPFTMGRWGLPVNLAALAWGVGAVVNMMWPRNPDAAWYDDYLVLLAAVVVVGIGLVYMLASGRAEDSTGPYSDAIPVKTTT
ncbi:APC family permease [Mycolicibacterium sediminis]|uniref:Amino acid permease n=1 Tax=Mycolicibacterium sediminis TaxID=1286180 RepID=A0A7I7QMK6_9MYCO|nr:amino acid permease [Mycolicibacterium sediminis]BBY27475.1 amino acid permease [Mycolicibacterium sediminis]